MAWMKAEIFPFPLEFCKHHHAALYLTIASILYKASKGMRQKSRNYLEFKHSQGTSHHW
jgi:hypothetical protein